MATTSSTALHALDRLIARAEDAGAIEHARRLKVESMRARASFERALNIVVEAISTDDDSDVMAEWFGDSRTLAEILLDE
jgi:hypothetical protein